MCADLLRAWHLTSQNNKFVWLRADAKVGWKGDDEAESEGVRVRVCKTFCVPCPIRCCILLPVFPLLLPLVVIRQGEKRCLGCLHGFTGRCCTPFLTWAWRVRRLFNIGVSFSADSITATWLRDPGAHLQELAGGKKQTKIFRLQRYTNYFEL